jgi:uncharacterized RDD family membrane protein YckC
MPIYYLYPGKKIRVLVTLVDFALLIVAVALNFVNHLTVKSRFLSALIVFCIIIYGPLMEYFFGATLGHMLFGAHIVGQSNQKPSLKTIGSRVVLFLPFLLTVSLMILSDRGRVPAPLFWALGLSLLILVADYAAVWFNPQKQAWHDNLAGTYCVLMPGRGRYEESSAIASELAKWIILLASCAVIYFIHIQFKPLDKLRPVVESLFSGHVERKEAKPAKAMILPVVKVFVESRDCVVKGIFMSPQGASIFINDQTHFIGDVVCGGEIIEIADNRVTLKFDEYNTIQFGLGSKIKARLRQ